MPGWLRSLFVNPGDSPEQPASEADGEAPAGPAPAGQAEIVSDLVQWVCAGNKDLTVDQVDPTAHVYDAGYVDSMRGAELLVHVEKRYGLFVPETDLVGNLSSLEALARHIAASEADAGE